MLLVIIIQGVPETCDSQGYTVWSVTYFCFCKSILGNSIVPQCALDCCRFFGTPCILYYTLYSMKETLRDQCTPTQKVMLLLFIIDPLIQENKIMLLRVPRMKPLVVGWRSCLTQCCTVTEVKHGRARSGVGWVTAQVIDQ